MKICLIASYMPWHENRGAACALLYWLIMCRPQDIDIQVLCLNTNSIPEKDVDIVREELKCDIKVIPNPRWNRIIRGSSYFAKLFSWIMPKPFSDYYVVPKKIHQIIQNGDYDAIWLYPMHLYRLAYKYPKKKFVVTGMDCESLNKLTRIADPIFLNHTIGNFHQWVNLRQDIRREKKLNKDNILYHVVGLADLNFYERHTRAKNSFFLLHPHYGAHPKEIVFSEDKLKVLFAGAYNFFTKTDMDVIVDELIRHNNLKEKIKITFLGRNWEGISVRLIEAGYECEVKTWVDNYIEEIRKYDIQVTPITNGGGTKAKILDAMTSGLLVVSSTLAYLNIAVRDNDSIVLYKRPEDVPAILNSIYNNKSKYEKIAMKGCDQILTYHNPRRCSTRFFGIVENWLNGKQL